MVQLRLAQKCGFDHSKGQDSILVQFTTDLDVWSSLVRRDKKYPTLSATVLLSRRMIAYKSCTPLQVSKLR
jgi:hypothetical protein